MGRALLLYVALALLLFAPVLGRFGTHCLAHPQGELPMKLWDQWRTSQALLEDGAFPEETTLVGFPRGGTLFPSDPLNSLVFLPVYAAFGPAARFNASPLFHLVFAAMAAWWLAWYLTESPGGALVAGAAYGFSPFLLSYGVESGCSEALAVGWFPLLLLFLVRTVREPGWASPVLAGVCAFLLTFSSLYYGVFGMLLVAVFLVGVLAARLLSRPVLLRLLVFAVVAGVLTLPFAWTVMRTVATSRSVLAAEDLQSRDDVFDPLQGTSGVLLDLVWPVSRERSTETRLVRVTYVGVLLLGLALWGVRGRQGPWLGAAAALFLLLFLGPRLQLSDSLYLPGPWNVVFLAFAKGFPLFSRIFEPFRLVVLVTLCLSLLAAYGVRRLGLAWWVGGLLAVVLVAEARLVVGPFSVTEPSRPEWCRLVAASPSAVIELPFTWRGGPLFHKRVFWWQTLHGRPIPNGVAFYPPLMSQSALYRQLVEHESPGAGPFGPAASGFAELRAMGFGCVVAHRDAYLPAAWAEVSGFLQGALGPGEEVDEGVWLWWLR